MDLDCNFYKSYLRLSAALLGYVPYIQVTYDQFVISLCSRQDEKNLAICALCKGKVCLAFKA